mgnify:CR=1 FL=1
MQYASCLQKYLQFDCGFIIKACKELEKEEGGHLSLRELWQRIGGPPGLASSAQKMLDRLMRGPIVAVRVAQGSGAETAWVVMGKQSDVN